MCGCENSYSTPLKPVLLKFGRLDIVVARAGIFDAGRHWLAMWSRWRDDDALTFDATDVDLIGVMNTVAVSIAHLADGGSIVITGSTAGMMSNTTPTTGA